ncbi:MAG: ABC transporter ATP-binding protein [Syntrophomonadaceae bacterium]|nr:ABC transporter ATP-binding protein [Syntrophomonadaceae bacterium]
MEVIRVNKVSKTLDNVPTLDQISLSLQLDEFVVILGPSGCGKSTLFNIIAGLIAPDKGSVVIMGEDWSGRTGRVSYMQQKDLLLPSCNVIDNISIPLLLKGYSKKAARKFAGDYMQEFGLDGFALFYPRQLSGAMKQRAALLRTYLFASDILLLDEPFASLDAITRRKMHKWLIEIRRRWFSSILFVTHDIEEALLLADRIYVFSSRPARVKAEYNLLDINNEQKEGIKQEIISILEEEAID